MKQRFTLFIGLVIAIVVGSVQEAKAQDPRFSQYYAAPSQLNPAMTGVFEGRWRFHANYREQWASIINANPFRTVSAGFDMKYNIVNDDYVAFGFSGISDRAGDSHFNTNRAHLSFAYLKHLGGGAYRTNDQFLIAGGQFGVGQHSIDNRLWFGPQYNAGTGVPDPANLPNMEPGELANALSTDVYLDFNAGLMYYALMGDNTSFYIGAAMNHLNNPNVSFFRDVPEVNGNETLATRWIAHAGGEIPFNTELSLLPAIQVMGQAKAFETNLGANFRYSNHDWREVAIRIGAWTRFTRTVEKSHMEALIIAAILEMERWNIGVSYDITTSSLTAANNSRGAFELSLIYTHPAKSRVRVKCPKF